MSTMRNDTDYTTDTTDTQIIKPVPSATFVITSRVWETKYVLTSTNDMSVRYYILAPPSYKHRKHASGWSAIVHAGDNPKYNSLSESPLVGRCKRAMFWNKFYIEYGGSVQRDVKRDEKDIKVKSLKTCNKFRKFFCTGEKELKWSAEEEAAATEESKGQTNLLEVAHTGHRRYEFGVDGRSYRWTGTRMHAGRFNKFMKMKGIAFDLKVCFAVRLFFGYRSVLIVVPCSWFGWMIKNLLPRTKTPTGEVILGS